MLETARPGAMELVKGLASGSLWRHATLAAPETVERPGYFAETRGLIAPGDQIEVYCTRAAADGGREFALTRFLVTRLDRLGPTIERIGDWRTFGRVETPDMRKSPNARVVTP